MNAFDRPGRHPVVDIEPERKLAIFVHGFHAVPPLRDEPLTAVASMCNAIADCARALGERFSFERFMGWLQFETLDPVWCESMRSMFEAAVR